MKRYPKALRLYLVPSIKHLSLDASVSNVFTGEESGIRSNRHTVYE